MRNSIRPVTWLGLAASAVLAISVVGLFYFQQRAVLLDSSMARQDRLLLDLAQALQDRLVSQMRLGVVVAYVVRRSPPEGEGREQAFALLSSDSAMEQLLQVREGAAPRRLWSRSDGPLRPGRRFYRFNREISATDLELSRGSDSARMATLSVRIKEFGPRTDLELVSSLRGLQLAVEPYMLNQGLSLGIVTQDGLWFPLFQRDSTDSGSFGHALPERLLAAFGAQEQGGFTTGDQDSAKPFPTGSMLKWRRIQVWGGVPWTLVLHAPESELAGNAAAQLWRYALVFGIVGLLWGLAVWQLVRRDLSIVRLQADLRHLQELRQKDEQIVRAEKLATIGVLVSGLAHEIGTPLGVVSMRLELLQRRFAAGSEESQTIDLVLGQLRRVTSLIRQLLDFARSKPGSAEPVDLGRVLSTVGDLMDPIARRRRVRLEVLAPGDLPMISGSSDSVQQILLNLVLNALQAVEENGLVRVEVESGEEGRVVVAVEDDGPGIPPEKRNAVFDPFFTTKRQGEGSGLGLTVVLGLVRRMGADLTLHESALGGAKFVLAFGRWDGK